MKTLYTTYNNFAKRLVMSLMVLMTVGVGTMLGDNVTLNSSTITNGKKLAYTTEWTYTANNVTWSGYCYTDANSRPWLQLKKDQGVYIKISTPDNTKITKFETTITSGTNSSGGIADITKHTDFSGRIALLTSDATGSTSMTGVAYTTSVSNDIATLSPSGENNVLYLKVSAGARIWSMTVTYESLAPACTYIVTFNSNYGTNATSSQEFTCGETKALTANSFSRTGYTFARWNTKADGTGTSYTNQQSVNLSSTNNDNITLYAQWTPTQYTITYNGLEGATHNNPTNYTIESETITFTAPSERVGYNFTGWNPSSITKGSTGNKTITAQWIAKKLTNYRTSCTEPSTFTVTYNGNGNTSGSVPEDNTEYAKDAQVTVLDNTGNLAKTSYTFNGWNTKFDGTGTPYTAGKTFTITENTTLYAQWKSIPTYTVTFDSDGGSDVASQTIEEGNRATKPADPTKEGYDFVGWYNGNTEFEFDEVITGDITLTAKWNIITYNIEYTGLEGATHSNPVTYDVETATITFTAPSNRDGYVFKGWTPASIAKGSTGDKTVTATWAKVYTITWKVNGEEYTEGTPTTSVEDGNAITHLPTAPSAPSGCSEKVFVGWTDSEISEETDIKPTTLFTDAVSAPAIDGDKTFHAVFADEEGGDFSLGQSGDFKIYANVNSTYYYAKEDAEVDKIPGTTDSNEATIYTFTKETIDGKEYYSIYNGSKYIGYSGSSTSLKETAEVEKQYWSVEKGTHGSWRVTSKNAPTRALAYRTSTYNTFRAYSTSGINGTEYYDIEIGGGTTYSDYTTTCVKLPDPVLSFATEPANPIVFTDAVCGGNSSKQSVTVVGENLRDVVNISVTGSYKIARTASTAVKDFTTSLTLDKTAAGAIHSNYQTVYIISTPPAQSTEATTGTLTFTTTKGNTLTVNLSTPTVTCSQYTLTLVDRGVSIEQPAKYYAGATINEAPADPEGVCTDPIHYVFDGWAETTVTNGSTGYTPVSFPYTVTGNTKFYAVYRYTGDGGEPSNDFIKVTSAKDDWTGDYVIVDEDVNKAIGNAYENTNTLKALDVTITDNKVVSPANEVIWQIRKNGEYYTMYNTAAEKYAYVEKADAKGAGLSTTAQNMQIIFNDGIAKVSGVNIYRCFYYYGTNTEWRTYATGSYNTGALYCRSLETYLYTSAPVCGPLVEITSDKDIYVTGGKGVHSTVVAQKKITFAATRLKPSAGGAAPSIKVPAADITLNGSKTDKVKIVDITQNIVLQDDGITYAGTGEITISYTPTESDIYEDINVQLRAEHNTGSDVILDAFIVHARSLPAEFVIVAKQGDKWYALNGDMSNGSSANPANGQITLNDDTEPTKATYAPCNTIYTFDGLPNTGDRKYVRFQGTDGAWLWAASGTNVGIQNKSLATTPAGDNAPYNWEIETTDNITYFFHNANSSRVLRLNDGKFGMYVSGTDVIRILPYDAKCLYNYAPTNLKVSVLKSTSVTLTWDAVAGATKYQYSTNGNTWTDAGTEPTTTISGLTKGTDYTYYIRAYHEDDATKECIDYSKIRFTTADCDDVPTNITYTADLNSITVSWTAAAPTATIKLYMNEDGTGGGGTYPGATSPYKISGGLEKNTTYYIQILADGTCASPIIPVKTKDVEVDIVEWKTDSIVVDINTNENISVTLENEVSYGSNVGAEATELFFSKYYEASYNVKLVAIYNGTKNIIDLTDYIIKYGKTSWESNYITLKDFGATKGQIQPGEEIILYSYIENDADDKKILDCVHDAFPDGNWVRVTSSNNTGKGILSFGGDKTLALFRGKNIIDIIGAVDGANPNNSKANEKPTWGDAKGWMCATGLSLADDSEIGISTNRCLLVRNNTVTSGANAVASNTTDFVTLCSEWKGAHVLDSDVDNGIQESCENFAYIGTFDYSDYYTKFESMGVEQVFDTKSRNQDGTITISIPELSKQSCRNIRIIIKDNNTKVISNQEYKVPIMITTNQGTDGEAFIALQENLAMIKTDPNGNPTGDKTNLTLEQAKEICKTCDVVVRDNATLTKMADDAANDHPQVRDVYVYENSSLIVPNGTNYTINNLSLRRKQDAVASLNVYPGALKLPESAPTPISLDLRVDANNWHWFTLPYDCNISEVTWVDGSPAQYNVDWFLMTYDGKQRANTQSGGCWKQYNGTTIEAGKGYIVGITGDINNSDYTFELRFPMAKEVLADETKDKIVDVRAWGVEETDIRPNHKGWNLVGNPYLAYYQRDNVNSFGGLRLGELIGPDPQTGYWEQTGNLPYVVVPVKGGWVSYEQVLVSETDLLPFTAYFVQVGNDGTHNSEQDLKVSFDHTKLQLSATPMPASIVHRAPSEVNETEEPLIVGVALTNSLGESDKTSLVIADRFTNEYEMQADFFKWFGDYYKYYTKPVLYTIGADQGKRAFNALNEQLATQPIPMGFFAAKAGDYTFALNRRSDLSKVEEVWLHDANTNTYTNLMQNDYNFYTTKTDGGGRFTISVKLAPKVATGMENVNADKVWATTQNQQIIVNGLENNTQLWMYDAAGKLLYTEVTSNYQHRYSVPQVGTYFIALQKGTTKQTIKVVVE